MKYYRDAGNGELCSGDPYRSRVKRIIFTLSFGKGDLFFGTIGECLPCGSVYHERLFISEYDETQMA